MTADNLDPKPWKCRLCSDRFVYSQWDGPHATVFEPRPKYSQNQEEYPR